MRVHAVEDRRLTSNDARARALVEAAIAASPTVASLVEGLGSSDVVVLVQVTLDVRFAGNLRFVACAGGSRFLVIRVFAAQPPEDQVATLGHELQHACEVGEAAGVRDERSLGELMARIGRATGRRTFETDAAVRVGRQVRAEVTRRWAASGLFVHGW